MMKFIIVAAIIFFLVWIWKIKVYLKRIRRQKETNWPFYRWDESIHNQPEQRKRLEIARNENCIFEPVGKRGTFYRIKYSSDPDFVNCAVGMCQCKEFKENHKPCKHIYKIAIENGLIDPGKVKYEK